MEVGSIQPSAVKQDGNRQNKLPDALIRALGFIKTDFHRGIGTVDWQMLLGHENFGPQSSKSDSEESRPHKGGNRNLMQHHTEKMQ